MTIQQSVQAIFKQLELSLLQLNDDEYCKKIETLSDATIGQHVRHVIEMFACLQQGYETTIVNYENRQRDIIIETSRIAAINMMKQIAALLFEDNKEITLEAGFDENSFDLYQIPSNYFREIAYNLEHAIHHMALIKIGIAAVAEIELPPGYGVASSTIKYRQSVVQ